MNKRIIAIVVVGALLSGSVAKSQTFRDKSALNLVVKGAVLTSKLLGAGCGAVGGAFVGLQIGNCLAPAAEQLGGDVGGRIGQSYGKASSNNGLESFGRGLFEGFRGSLYGAEKGAQLSGVCGAAGGGLSGAYVVWKGSKKFSTFAIATFHRVSCRAERISQYYNINVSQYRPIFVSVASEQGNAYALKKAVCEVFPKRFGENWQERLVSLFETYGDKARRVLNYSFFRKNDDMREFIRMIELGAAMANLHYGTNPDPKNTVNSAISLYKELDLIQ